MNRIVAAVAGLVLASIATAPAIAARCAMTPPERDWVEGSLRAWQLVSIKRLKLPSYRQPTIVVFDARCRFERTTGAWKAEPHKGQIRIPDGGQVPARVTSFAGGDDATGPFFVMALPSIWEAANIPISGDMKGLTGVFLHEFSHTRQVPALQPRFRAAAARFKPPENLDDDAIQKLFGKDPAYLAVVEKENRLLYEAAHEPDDAKARQLAGQALALIEARQKRWFTGPNELWKAYDDIFLSMEGAGQWVAYAWLADPQGGRLAAADAERKMRGKRNWWSQDEGLSLVLILDRFVPDWPQRMFAAPGALGIDLLREAAATPGSTKAAA